MRDVCAFVSGLVFGLGPIAGGPADPAKAKAFVDRAGAWNPSLALVMGGAAVGGVFAFAAAKRRTVSWTGEHVVLPTIRVIDAPPLGGGVLFAAGRGLAASARGRPWSRSAPATAPPRGSAPPCRAPSGCTTSGSRRTETRAEMARARDPHPRSL